MRHHIRWHTHATNILHVHAIKIIILWERLAIYKITTAKPLAVTHPKKHPRGYYSVANSIILNNIIIEAYIAAIEPFIYIAQTMIRRLTLL